MVSAISTEFDLTTRSKFSKVDCVMSIKVDGVELPNLAVMGEALEAAVNEVQRIVTESYIAVPERVPTPPALVPVQPVQDS